MATLSSLRRQAAKSTNFQGHHMKWITPWHGEHSSLQTGICRKCGKEVYLNTHPLSNNIDIGGEAVALNCINKS